MRSFKMDPQPFAGSKPEQRALVAGDGSLAHFVYTRDGDNGGLIYWLGTRRWALHIPSYWLVGSALIWGRNSDGVMQGRTDDYSEHEWEDQGIH